MRQFRNGFGIDFATQRTVWFNDANDPDCPTDCTDVEACPPPACSGMCPLDSDGDGLSNGVELGDPDCVWRPGDGRPNIDATHPGDPRDPDRCGNDELDAGEECDGRARGERSCADFGFLEGELGCRGNCTYDDSVCEPLPEPDAEVVDAEVNDAEVFDAEIVDAEIVDAEIVDEGIEDLGPEDAGVMDALVPIEDSEVVQDAAMADLSLGDGERDSAAERSDMNPPRSSSPAESGGCFAAGHTGSNWPKTVLLAIFVGWFIRVRR